MSVERLELLSALNGGEMSVNQARIIRNITLAKDGIIDAIGKEKGERFIGRNIEIILTGAFADWSEEETLTKCELVFD